MRVGELIDPAASSYGKSKDYEQAYRSLGMQRIIVDVADPTQLERVIADVARMRADALIVRSNPLFTSNREQICSLALKHALPTIAEGKLFTSAGCLASYAGNSSAFNRGSAVFVDKILKGAKPGDLPIEQPTKFDIVINLKTAKALGVTIPNSLRVRADEVIQ
jgi:putative ABC transport system substrate-binding protein